MKSKYIVAALLSIMILFTSLPVSASEISGNDANNGIMLLNSSRLINNNGPVSYPYERGTLVTAVSVPEQTSHFDIKLRTFYLYLDNDWNNNNCNILIFNLKNGNVSTVPYENNDQVFSIRSYQFYILLDGKKYYLENQYTNLNIGDRIQTGEAVLCVEFDTQINRSDYGYANNTIYPYSSGQYIYIDTEFDFDLSYDDNSSYGLLSGIKYTLELFLNSIDQQIFNFRSEIHNHINNILTYITDFKTNMNDNFNTLFSKIDEDQEEVINGYDPSTGDTADSDFNAGADELHNVESSLFQSAAYDEVDYSQYNDFFSLTGVAGAISFVSSFFESLYAALGIYAVPFTIGLVLIIITRILGYQNFSAGGG